MFDARPDRSPSRLSRASYAIAGGLALAFGGMSLLGVASSAANGCRLVSSQNDFTTDPTAMPSGGCEQFVDLVGIAGPLLIGVVLVAAAVRYPNRDRFSTATKALAIPAGVVASAMPLLAYWQLHSFYRLAYGPAELAFFGLGFTIAVLGLIVAYRTALLIRDSARVRRSATDPGRPHG